MYYSYNSITGRLTGTTQMKAYIPQGVNKLGPSPPVNPYPPTWAPAESRTYTQKNVDPHQPIKAAGTTAVPGKSPEGIRYGPVPEHIKRAQEIFQRKNNLLVHLKGGPKDKVYYYISIGLAGIGMIAVVNTFYTLMFPKKPE